MTGITNFDNRYYKLQQVLQIAITVITNYESTDVEPFVWSLRFIGGLKRIHALLEKSKLDPVL